MTHTPTVFSEHEKQRMRQYLLLMHEVRLRFDVINAAHENKGALPPQMVREICYLQFRFMCEIVALACLVAHGSTSKKLMDMYEADKIVNEMQKLNPNFYPQPCELNRKGNGIEICRSDRVHLTREKLAELWGRAGDTLHRSPLSKYAKLRRGNPADFSDILSWSSRLSGLLNTHLIAISESRSLVVGLMDEETGNPTAVVMDFSPATNTVNITKFKSI